MIANFELLEMCGLIRVSTKNTPSKLVQGQEGYQGKRNRTQMEWRGKGIKQSLSDVDIEPRNACRKDS